MNNLESLKSQLLLEYSEEDLDLWRSKNFYQHHNLPFRSLIKTREGSTNGNSGRSTLLHFSPKKSVLQPKPQVCQPFGRNLFDNRSTAHVPGPGYYDNQILKNSSSCYIKKQQKFVHDKIAKRLRRRQLINECRGPGVYNPEKAFNFTSKSKSASLGKISDGKFTRGILSAAKNQNLYLASTLSERFLKNNDNPGPNRYQLNNSSVTNSNPEVHRISNTLRSNIVKQDGLPGPGFYKWDQLFERKVCKSKDKGKVEYRFVYGHPS